jgi:hypothetical protein
MYLILVAIGLTVVVAAIRGWNDEDPLSVDRKMPPPEAADPH